ncbi:MAG: hypothetical protein HQ594_02280 [Candidatus Omnitrophica bacterium]|nr:hypothetical protein [Candidatus Omnitrophota bacterium]
MSRLRISALMVFVAVFCIGTCTLSGCGKKEKAPKKTTGALEMKEAAQTGKEEIPQTPSTAPITEERVYYDFESDLNGWEVPLWALGKSDYIAEEEVVLSEENASEGKSSMKVMTNFVSGKWNAALVEIQQYLDLSRYRVISADLYIPPDAPVGLKAKIILTVGDSWKFVEMSRSVPLIPGKWVTISSNIEPGSYDWKRVIPDKNFAEDVRKVAIRIECNRKPDYSGPIYVDNIRVGR